MTEATSPPTTATPNSSAAAPGGVPGIVHTTREIEALIPHRWPFLLVDRIVEYQPEAKRIVGLKAVSASEWFFQGHFPGLPVMPGVLQVEALAQVGAIALLSQPAYRGKIVLFARIENVRFRKPVTPGDTLRLEVQLERMRGRIGKGHGVARVGDGVAAEGDFTFAVADAPAPGATE